ncbi:MAG: citrate lyase acyl carrier protein [Pyramidobacter sp.]|uniref:citrate lyase acyl carrier protein n=1 Tax=unclassified Pyramidobacter TaxID=2632171 RepID=UPI000EA0D10D|nr:MULTISPECIES: citrate lyase acyl carrier protein [unclassified Pyramidobacter]MDY4031512.1 citrate lyase acyl carrier protein [Pyramidobacter sp.]RKJ76135.1 citrate lyase acyl carrier protein [Pyramidobacter sp. CG50-2]
MKTASAGTLESMDCLVTVTEAAPGSGLVVELEGSGVSRFRSAMEKTVRDTLEALGANDLTVNVNDRGALDVVLEARVETAVKRLRGER